MTSILNKIRYLLNDIATTGVDNFTYGSNSIFTISEPNAITVTDVTRNDTSSGVTYTFTANTLKTRITSTLSSGDSVSITYTYYPNYSDVVLTAYVQAALVHLSINNYYDFEYDSETDEIFPTPDDRQENLIALVTSVLIDPDNKTIRLPDITIQSPSDIPTGERISKLISKFKGNSSGIFEFLS